MIEDLIHNIKSVATKENGNSIKAHKCDVLERFIVLENNNRLNIIAPEFGSILGRNRGRICRKMFTKREIEQRGSESSQQILRKLRPKTKGYTSIILRKFQTTLSETQHQISIKSLFEEVAQRQELSKVFPTETYDLSVMSFSVTPHYSPIYENFSHFRMRKLTGIRSRCLIFEQL